MESSKGCLEVGSLGTSRRYPELSTRTGRSGIAYCGGFWLELDIGPGDFASTLGNGDADNGAIDDRRVSEEDGFDFGGGDLPAADFYEVLVSSQ